MTPRPPDAPPHRTPAESVDEVLALYERWGHDHYDEVVSQLDHATQTAALAVRDGAPDELVAAALLHDVGHLLDLDAAGPAGARSALAGGGDLHHEASGARYLAALFPPAVTRPVALHVVAKRYRCAVDPAYLDGLSDGSRASLAVQGGPFGTAEADAFAARPGAPEAIALRGWDDEGKVDGLATPGLDHYRPLLERVANGAAANRSAAG